MSDSKVSAMATATEQRDLPLPQPRRPRPSPLVEHGRTRDEQRAVARIISRSPSLYCAGLQRWAALVLDNEREELRRNDDDDDFQA